MSYPYLFQGENIVVVVDNKPYTFGSTHIAYDRLKEAIKLGWWDEVRDIIDPKEIILQYGNGNLSLVGDKLMWDGLELNNVLANRIVQMWREGFDIDPMVRFMENLMQNPSSKAVQELYDFLEVGNLPITPDGCFLSYKKVRGDYFDCHSGTVLNKPAVYMTEDEKAALATSDKKGGVTVAVEDGVTVVSMPRNFVDDERDNHCSRGLHFCSLDYLSNFGGERIVILKINPRDVVSIPSDYNFTKGRTCRYEIVDEIDKDKADAALVKSVQETAVEETSVLSDQERLVLSAILKALNGKV
jgi:hypothetical protein